MEKKPFVTKEQLEEIAKTYPTPFYLYDEKGIRENALKLKEAFSWNKGFREYFAVKATPNPFILKILQELGCGTDCSSKTELLMSDACGFSGHDIMFSSNDTPPRDHQPGRFHSHRVPREDHRNDSGDDLLPLQSGWIIQGSD